MSSMEPRIQWPMVTWSSGRSGWETRSRATSRIMTGSGDPIPGHRGLSEGSLVPCGGSPGIRGHCAVNRAGHEKPTLLDALLKGFLDVGHRGGVVSDDGGYQGRGFEDLGVLAFLL